MARRARLRRRGSRGRLRADARRGHGRGGRRRADPSRQGARRGPRRGRRSGRNARPGRPAERRLSLSSRPIQHPIRSIPSVRAPVCRSTHGVGRMSGMSSETVVSPRPDGVVSPRPDGQARPRADIEARTLRQDRWWLQPLIIAVGFAAFVVYATWAAFNHPIVAGPAHRTSSAPPSLPPLSPPCFVKGCPPQADWAQLAGPQWISPALYILIFPLAFRTTCYYYRKAY